MNKRKAMISQPHALRQKQLLQSIFKFLPLAEASLSATVCKSWHSATREGLAFHPECLELINVLGEWEICSEARCVFINDIPEPKRSHLLEIVDTIHFDAEIWRDAMASLTQSPPNLKQIEFGLVAALPTQEELIEMLAKIDVSKVGDVKFDFRYKPMIPQFEHIVNAIPSLKKAEIIACFNDSIDFKQIRPIETVALSASGDLPNLERRVKVLELVDCWDDAMIEFDSDLIKEVEKITWRIEVDDEDEEYNLELFWPVFFLRCSEIPLRLSYLKETSVKSFEIDAEDKSLLQHLFDRMYNVDDCWEFSLSTGKLLFNRIDK